MPKINLEKLSLAELEKLTKDVDRAIEQTRRANRKEALKAARDAAAKYGFSLDELVGTSRTAPRKKKPGSPPKYAHPENPAVTWTGRGRQPGWIKDALAAGKSLDDFLIKG